MEKWCQYKYCGATLPPLPNAPADLTSEVISYSQIDLSWTDLTDNEDGFIIEQETAGSYSIIATVDANVTSFSCIDLTELTEYTYSVQAFNISGFSDYSNITTATTDSASSTSARQAISGRDLAIHIFPNPFHSSTQIEFSIPGSCLVSLKVYDMSGRELETLVHEKMPGGQHVIMFDGSDLSGGTYFYILHAGDNVESGRFILL